VQYGPYPGLLSSLEVPDLAAGLRNPPAYLTFQPTVAQLPPTAALSHRHVAPSRQPPFSHVPLPPSSRDARAVQ
jgi:hypothetical protein